MVSDPMVLRFFEWKGSLIGMLTLRHTLIIQLYTEGSRYYAEDGKRRKKAVLAVHFRVTSVLLETATVFDTKKHKYY